MCMKKTHTRITWIVICTNMCMTKTHKNMDSHSYKDVHDENSYKNNVTGHPHKDVHAKNPSEYG